MDRAQLLHASRIASAFIAIVALALCVLWIGSYSRAIVLQGEIPKGHGFSLRSRNGSMQFVRSSTLPAKWYVGPDGVPGVLMVSSTDRRQICFVADPAITIVRTPHWLMVLLCMTPTAFVGLPQQLPFRFSLRTLLIATTLVAIVLGAAVWALR
jgi:hypothetical protein